MYRSKSFNLKISIILSFWIFGLVHAQDLDWVVGFECPNEAGATAVTTDSLGNIFVSGYFYGTCDFDPGPGSYILTTGSNNPKSYVSKLDRFGNHVWTVAYGPNWFGGGYGILHSKGYLYIVGLFEGSSDFDPGPSNYFVSSSAGSGDVYLLKLDVNGNFIWVGRIGGPEFENGWSISADQKGNIYITGQFTGTADFDPGPGVRTLTSSESDVYFLKCNPNGNLIWAKKITALKNAANHGIRIKNDRAGNVYVYGDFVGEADFDPGPRVEVLTSRGDYDIFITKLDEDGNLIWAKSFGGRGVDQAKGIFIDQSANIYCTGTFNDTIDLNTGFPPVLMNRIDQIDGFVCKYNKDGDLVWARQMGGLYSQSPRDIAMDGNGIIHVVGNFRNHAELLIGQGGIEVSSLGSNDLFVLSLADNGNFICANSYGGKAYEFVANMTVDYNDNPIVVGVFSDTSYFSVKARERQLISKGNIDPFVLKLNACNFPKIIDSITVCGPFLWRDGKTYDSSTYGINYRPNSQSCCDSLYILQLTVKKQDSIILTQSSCDSIYWNGMNLKSSGIYYNHSFNAFGCDSTTVLQLNILPSNSSYSNMTVCDSVIWSGLSYDQSGIYLFQTINQFGCDSIASLNLTVNKNATSEFFRRECKEYPWNGQTYTASGRYTFQAQTQHGCDSTVILNLTIDSVIRQQIGLTTCDRYDWNGQTLTQSGTYTHRDLSQAGCDSIVTLDLKVLRSTQSNTKISACDRYAWNGNVYTQSGTYSFTATNADGCDSTATLELTILSSSSSMSQISNCESYLWNGNNYTQSGNYEFKTQNAEGCDSTAKLELTILPIHQTNIQESACDQYFWNGITYNQSGNYSFNTKNQFGCDSSITLELEILKSSSANISLSTCDSLIFQGQTLKASGSYAFSLRNAAGCDSSITLDLSILSNKEVSSVSSCDPYRWDADGKTYDQSGQYQLRYTNTQGCDSIHILDFRRLPSYSLTQREESCGPFLWSVNNQRLDRSGLYEQLYKTREGCDSLLQLDLQIHPSYLRTDTVISAGDYLWPVNGSTYTGSGLYEEKFASEHGCDSLHRLLLIIRSETGIYAPNVLLPGGISGGFTLYDNGHSIASIATLSIYDRWGNLVWQKQNFAPSDPALGWDGRFKGQPVLPGVYTWQAQLSLKDGSYQTMKGDLTVVR